MPDVLLARSTRPDGNITLVATVTQVATASGEDGETVPVYRIDALTLGVSDAAVLGSATVIAARADGPTFERTFTRASVDDPLSTSRNFNGNGRWRMDSVWSFGLAVS